MIENLKRLLVLSATILASLALLAGCGDEEESDSGGGGGGGETPAVSSDATPSEVYQEFSAALAAGDADTACPLLSPDGLKQVEAASIGGTCEDWVSEIDGVLTPEFRDALENAQVKSEKIQGDSATLKVKDPVLNLPLDVELDQIDGAWKLSKLSSFV